MENEKKPSLRKRIQEKIGFDPSFIFWGLLAVAMVAWIYWPKSAPCLIKGNINEKGTKIFHQPGDMFYDKTVIDESKGERWFCSPEEAKDAGWRHSSV